MEKKEWCIKQITPQFLAQMTHILDLYEQPYNEQEPVVCIDEKSKQLLAHLKDPLPLAPNHGIRQDYHYKRNGTRNLFLMVEPKGKYRHIEVTIRRTQQDYIKFLEEELIPHYLHARKIHLVSDNLNIHTLKCLKSHLPPDHIIFQKIEFHYTPTHASWLNQAELEIGILDKQCLDTRIPSEEQLISQIMSWERERNQKKIGIKWTFTSEKADKIFKKKKAS